MALGITQIMAMCITQIMALGNTQIMALCITCFTLATVECSKGDNSCSCG